MMFEPRLLSVPSFLRDNLPEVLVAFCVLLDRATHHFRFTKTPGHRALNHQNIFIAQGQSPLFFPSALLALFQTLPWQTNVK